MTSKDSYWQPLVTSALKITSQCQNQDLFVKAYNLTSPWEYLMATWVYPTILDPTQFGKWDTKVLNSHSTWSEATRGIRSLLGQGMSTNLYGVFVSTIQSIRVDEARNVHIPSFWTLERFLMLLKPLEEHINIDYAALLQPWPEGNEDMLLSLQKDGLANIPEIKTFLDPAFVTFIETLWDVQGTLQNASSLWRDNKTNKPAATLELPTLGHDTECS